jgi:hypothetical protein
MHPSKRCTRREGLSHNRSPPAANFDVSCEAPTSWRISFQQGQVVVVVAAVVVVVVSVVGVIVGVVVGVVVVVAVKTGTIQLNKTTRCSRRMAVLMCDVGRSDERKEHEK